MHALNHTTSNPLDRAAAPPATDGDAGTDALERAAAILATLTLRQKAGLLFHPFTEIPDDPADRGKALEHAARLIEEEGITHFVMANGSDAESIGSWTSALDDIATNGRTPVPLSISTDPRNGFKSTEFTGLQVSSFSRWPENIGLAAARDPDLVRAYGDAVRQELLSVGIRVYLGPMADLFTEPRWGRGYGTFGEDPDLAGTLTAAFIEGLRGGAQLGPRSVASVVKHFPGAGPQLNGDDAIDPRFPEQVYPGNAQEIHLRPFQKALAAGVTQVMLYYGMPVGTDWDEVGFAFNKPVVDGLLRRRLGFDGIVTTDWNVISSEPIGGVAFGPIAHGMESSTVPERLIAALDAGVDQFGGDICTTEIVQLVESGRLTEERLDASALRILSEKVRLGLFDDPTAVVPSAQPSEVVSASALGRQAQERSLTLVSHRAAVLPISRSTRVYLHGFADGFRTARFIQADDPSEADVIIARIASPHTPDPDSLLGEFPHRGSLAFDAATSRQIRLLSQHAPVVLVVWMERPAILTELAEVASATIVEYGASDDVVCDAAAGVKPFTGRLPFDLPRSMDAVLQSRADVPFDTEEPLFRFGHGETVGDGIPAPR